MQITRKQTILLSMLFIFLAIVMLVLFSIQRNTFTTERPQISVAPTNDFVDILKKKIKDCLPMQSLQVTVDDESVIHLSAELTKETFQVLLDHYDISLSLLPFLPNSISANIDFKADDNLEPPSISVLRLEIAGIDLTELLGEKLSEVINQAVKSGWTSTDFHR